jgi:hypothetical protein
MRNHSSKSRAHPLDENTVADFTAAVICGARNRQRALNAMRKVAPAGIDRAAKVGGGASEFVP